ncbi:MAG TPA: cytochrome C oxidase Cbb3, partial [Rhodospirillaceae bacterium]|nr:cytochrome C oxidase Cbb3 [Rhodospirillaceae bacterium]
LNDDAWIWGGAVDQIYSTIAHGIRYDQDEDTRLSEMPAFGRDGILSAAEIRDLANYVRSLSGQDHDAASVAAATPLFADNCAACHGEAGEGNQDLGAPNLSDAVWLYGSDTDAIASQIQNPSHGVMPAWLDRLGDVTVKKLSVYVHSLGGGE